jgi:ribosomal protein S18 acetylase RimI-like enzyme
MKLITVTVSHIEELMTWFSDKQELTDWAGPNFSYPFDQHSFSTDLQIDTIKSFALIANDLEMVAFGQFYQRLDKCHLGRLIVRPSRRGKGIAAQLMKHLSCVGLKQLQLTQCSLFVYSHNRPALNAYKSFGFTVMSYPQALPDADCLYLIK